VTAAEVPLPPQRHRFDLPDDVAYLNCAYMAPQLRSVTAAGQAAVAAKARPWEIGPRDFFSGVEGLRSAFAALNCHWTDGGLVDLAAVRAACDEHGAALVVDASQSLGALGLDVAAVRPDVLVSVGYKWLLGPYSLGFAWFAPHLRDGRPLEETWYARAGSEDFARLVDYADDYQPGARRYDVGEVANFALVPMAAAALAQIADWGVPRIAATLRGLTDELVGRAAEHGLTAAPAHLRAPHLVGLRLPADADPEALAAALAERHVHVSIRGRSVRVSPHLWTTPADIDRFAGALAAAVRP
jgi:selenocysteine lyase/cysteine desulfurase